MTDDIAMQCAANVRETCYLLVRIIGTEVGKRALSFREIMTLMTIREERDACVSFLAEQIGSTVSGASKLVDGLVDMGYITRKTAREDRRRLVLTLTDDGNRVLDTINDEEMLYLNKIVSTFSPAECEMVSLTMNLLRKTFMASQLELIQDPA
ncbi:MAG: MarR family transcriptional regulator [Armatimonadota bacterium]|nr:MarR family transcriptional regulator [bacterium]